VTSRLAAHSARSGAAIRSPEPRRKAAKPGRQAVLTGDCRDGSAGFDRTAVVLVGCFDCRSRQAAHGPSRPRAKSSWTTAMGLASPRESVRGRRRRVGSRLVGGKAARPVAGSQTNQTENAKAPPESICRWKAPRIGEAALIDVSAAEAVLAPGRSRFLRIASGCDRGRQRSFANFVRG
jgi:hypothetical protein